MTTTAKIQRIEHDGPGGKGLEVWEPIDPAGLVSGEPVQRGHIYHEIPAEGYLMGVWDCTAFTAPMGPYGEDEFMFFLGGTLTMGMPDGSDVEIAPGDAFIIPKGLDCQWKQPGFVHKIFMILDGPVPEEGANPSLPRITVPDLGPLETSGAVIATRTDFVNAAGTMCVELQECAAAHIPHLPVPDYRILHVLEGTLTLHDGEGAHSFAKGETAYIHQNGTVGWHTTEGTRLVVARYHSPG
ncbi:MAG: cupin domain-containing protein [Roseovarius sp.]